ELERRLRHRATDSEVTIKQRLRAASEEIEASINYDVLVVNDDLKIAYEQFKAAYLTATLAPRRNQALLKAILGQA
ncbi:MAG: guanylate kinase, partial [Desulfovibrio sp.]|nr:guanylate kinase [Desulfovibrio sp.]